jgi:hypothetical protein
VGDLGSLSSLDPVLHYRCNPIIPQPLRKGKDLGAVGILNLGGLALMSLLMILPGVIDHSSPTNVTVIGHSWFVLLPVSVGLLTAGMLLGFPYRFPRFAWRLGVLFLVGWGLSEVAFRQASFPWLVRMWKLNLGRGYLDAFLLSDGWQIAGVFKFLMGLGTIAILVIASRRRSAREALE